MKALLLRRAEAAERDALALAAASVETICSPLITIEPQAADIPAKIGSLAFTSAPGVSSFAAQDPRRDLTVYAVGQATAAAAEAVGFRDISLGDGDGASLAGHIIRSDASTPVVHFRGRDTAFDLCGVLKEAGVEAQDRIVYRAEAATALSPPAVAALAAGEIGVIAFHSTRISRIFTALAAGCAFDLSHVVALAISENAADPLSNCGFGEIRTAAGPNGPAMIAGIAAIAYEKRG